MGEIALNVKLLFSDFSWKDALDILFITVIVYYFLKVSWGKKGQLAFVGFMLVLVPFGVVNTLGLPASSWIFKNLVPYTVILLVVLFQVEIRDFLQVIAEKVFKEKVPVRDKFWQELMIAVMHAARNKIGMLVVIKQKMGLEEYIETGVRLNAEVTAPLLMAIFSKSSPLHDGAVIVEGNNIVAASCWLPLTLEKMPVWFGSRHRAAKGVTDVTDAVAIVVSEETGAVRIFYRGDMRFVSPQTIYQAYREMTIQE